jgi:virulence-associated protein VagC
MRKEGERLIIEPVPKKSVLALLATMEPIDEEFPEIDNGFHTGEHSAAEAARLTSQPLQASRMGRGTGFTPLE